MLPGLALAIAASLAFAVCDGLRKHLVGRLAPAMAGAFLNGGQAILLVGGALFAGVAWPDDPRFYAVVAFNAVIHFVTTLLYLRAVQLSPLSLTVPYLAFTPPLLVLTALLVLGEIPTRAGALGVVLVALGAYLLPGPASWRAPLAALGRERGSRLMLAVAALWAVTSALDKWAVRAANPGLYAGLVLGGSGLLALAWARRGFASLPTREVAAPLAATAALGALAVFMQFSSYAWLPVSYTIAIKRAGMLGSVLIGWAYFGETGLRDRLVGALIMVAGGACIVLWG